MSDNIAFYHNLPAMSALSDITDSDHYVDVPPDWYIALTDVIDSTVAIEAGRYKAVNTVAAVTITAVLNIVGETEVPYVFGGDGATVLVPPHNVERVREGLAAIKHIGATNFDLQVRAGVIPVADVVEAGYAVRAGKIGIDRSFQQPVFTGGGLEHADRLLKAAHTAPLYEIAADADATVDLEGYECRWNKHPAAHGEVISLLVRANDLATYDDIIATIQRIYGNPQNRHPIEMRQMHVSLNPGQYHNELGWKLDRVHWYDNLYLMLYSIIGYLLWKFVDKIWNPYREQVHNTTDNEKFDDTLRLTISGSAQQRQQLCAYLDDLHQRGAVAYGIHISTHSLMTCIVFDRFGRQVHFLDGADGGYAMAARGMKAQMKSLAARP